MARDLNEQLYWIPFAIIYYFVKRRSHRIRRHGAQVQLLVKDVAKAAGHPVAEDRPLGRHRKRPDIRAHCRTV